MGVHEENRYHMHIRVTDRSFIPFWRDERTSKRFEGWFWTFFVLLWILSWMVVIRYGDFSGVKDYIIIAVPNIFMIAIFSYGYATMMYLPARTGTVLIGEDVKFIKTLFVPLRRKTDFREVVFLVIGECPIIVNLWQGGRGFTADKVKMAKHYGSHYIVAYSRSGTLFGMTFNKDAWNLLIKKCPGAQIFEKEADFLEFIREQKERAETFEEKMIEDSGMQSFDGYIN